MASVVGKYAAKRLLGKQMDKHRSKKVAGHDDPYFVEVPGRNGKMKKVKKQIPDFIPENDAKCLASAKSLAYKMDMALFTFAGVRFGWGSVIGIIPELGDIIDLFFAMMVYRRCKAIDGGLPSGLQTQMVLNIVIDFFIGLIPFIGDLADAAYRCNTKNVLLLENHLRKKYGPEDKKLRQTAGYEFFEDDPDYVPDRSHTQQTVGTTAPEPAVSNQTRKGSWLGGNNRARDHDVELGRAPVAAVKA